MVTALYRRYRPETFAELIGQAQVTDPLRTALRTDRVNHAYLFSGPRGCGKTTSARILARCLNCVEGPTDEPCGVCPSCVELSRDGGGSLDVVEIDAASHGGVDDARDLRERAIFAPARDRYKIFIIDEAHMVTSGGFNALLKIVEEPPEHVKFIFATTEPEKVIGTIRSRTHHYPFRLVPPAQMLEYIEGLIASEGVTAAAGVLPLVVRAGGGSVRDTLSLLDQLIAGSDDTSIDYERAVALLGYTHGALLDEVIDALAARDASAVFAAIDRVIQTGQDPRRFVEDLLERLRDLIVVAATGERAASVLRGTPQDELDTLARQAPAFGNAELSRAADVVNAALTDMVGATSPRLHLELMVARLLVPAVGDAERGALARVERLERRIGVDAGPDASVSPASSSQAPAWAAARGDAPSKRDTPPVGVPESIVAAPASAAHGVSAADAPAPAAKNPVSTADAGVAAPSTAPASAAIEPQPHVSPARAAEAAWGVPGVSGRSDDAPPSIPVGPVTVQQVRDTWPQVLERVQKVKRSAWAVVFNAQPRDLVDDVLTLSFPNQADVDSFRKPETAGEGVSEILRRAIFDALGVRVKFLARVVSGARDAPRGAGAPPSSQARRPSASTASAGTGAAPASAEAGAATAADAATKPRAAGSPEGSRSVAAPPSQAAERPGVGPAYQDPGSKPRNERGPAASSADARSRGGASSAATGAPAAARPAARGRSVTPPAQPESIPFSEDDVPPPDDYPDIEPPTPEEPASLSWDVAPIPGSVPSPVSPPSESAGAPAAQAASGGGGAVSEEPRSNAASAAASPAAASPSASSSTATSSMASSSAVQAASASSRGLRSPATVDSPARAANGRERYGEAVVREVLGARFIEEQPLPSASPSASTFSPNGGY
ncbi:DNA polymerase III subunit gamma and tau [Ruicaihuangia caeni]|uniref:DNA-directed DNA polymerase n=1 Tax=Ruicaihuangia caeni TaxID=3042517 RepID=A0AAW6T6V7_9MICO|nr:DNA polymerase III subunit gamma and tau [Klugiella sp. YN-L-19]MDI2098821.1 DNA polymerase III subunit gamma and tau [Klugiella sp. YN-L-19]